MVELLLKLFIHDYKNTSNQVVRTKYGILGSIVGLVSNIILVISKLVVGLLFFNISIIADALNNLSDFFNFFLNLFGFKVSNKPADEDHPYGHQRMEYIISLIISVVIMLMGVIIIIQAIKGIINPPSKYTSFPLATIIVLGISILIKIFQSITYYSLGKRINSISLNALGADSRNDVISTTGVLVGVFISYYTGFTQIDGIIAILVGIFIIYSGIGVLIKTSDILLGEKPSQELIDKFVELIKSDENVLGVHDLEMHSYGQNNLFASIHVEVDGSKDVYQSHDMIDNLEHLAYSKLNIKTVIHMDPIKVNDQQTDRCKKIVTDVINNISKDLTIHDFRIVSGPSHINVIFDIVIPHNLTKQEKEIINTIKQEVNKIDNTLHLKITIDEQYTLISKENQ